MGDYSDFGKDPSTGGGSNNKTRVFVSVYNNLIGSNNDAHAEGGDSGSPCIVPVGNRGALVGTHTAIAQTGATLETFHTYVPFYANELNTIMAANGYHMTRAVPAAYPQPTTTLSVTPIPTTLRAGYPFTINLAVQNTGNTNSANNLNLSHALPAGSLKSATGTLWITSGELNARKGGLNTGTSSTLTLNLTIAQPGNFNSALAISADETPETTQNNPLTIIESYRSWSSDLGNSALTADSDSDGVLNLLEYAFAGNP